MNKNIKKLAQAKADKEGEHMGNRSTSNRRVTSNIPSVYTGRGGVEMPSRSRGYRTGPTQIGRENALDRSARVTKVDGKTGLYPNLAKPGKRTG